MFAVLIVAQVFALRTVVGLVALSLFIVELKTTAATVFRLRKVSIFPTFFTLRNNFDITQFSPHTSSTC